MVQTEKALATNASRRNSQVNPISGKPEDSFVGDDDESGKGNPGPATLTVGDLINELKQFDENSPVFLGHPSGDYWQTQIAKAISTVEMQAVKYSDYHQQNTVADEGDEDSQEVVFID